MLIKLKTKRKYYVTWQFDVVTVIKIIITMTTLIIIITIIIIMIIRNKITGVTLMQKCFRVVNYVL